jgi:hypothetical protein
MAQSVFGWVLHKLHAAVIELSSQAFVFKRRFRLGSFHVSVVAQAAGMPVFLAPHIDPCRIERPKHPFRAKISSGMIGEENFISAMEPALVTSLCTVRSH